jgi:tetratricopeptide (TPR) repeat protein
MSSLTKICISFASEDDEIAFRVYAQLQSMISNSDSVVMAHREAGSKIENCNIPDDITHLVVLCSNASARSISVSLQIEKFLGKKPRLNVLPVKLIHKSSHADKDIMPSALLHSMGENYRLQKQEPLEFIAEIITSNPDYADAAKKIIIRSGLKSKSPFMAPKVVSPAIAASVIAVLAVTSITLNNSVKKLAAEADSANLFANTVIMELEKGLPKDVQAKHLAHIGDAAISALSARSVKALSDGELLRRAKLLHITGNAQNLSGDPAKALESFRQANSFTKELIMRHPNNNDMVFDHSQSAFWVGNTLYRKGDLKEAKKAFTEYQRYSEWLVSREPNNKSYRAEKAFALVNSGIIDLETGYPLQALTAFQSATSILDDNLIAEGYATINNKANALGWEADAYLELGKYTEAKKAFLLQKKINADYFKAHSNSSSSATRFADTLLKLAKIEIDDGNDKLAEGYASNAIDLMRYVSEKDPSNIRFRTVYISAIETKSEIRLARGDYITAKLLNDETRKFRSNNDLLGANDARFRELASMKILSAKIALAADAPSAALTEISSALVDIERALSVGTVRKSTFLKGEAEFIKGIALEHMGRSGEAKASWRTAILTLKNLKATQRKQKDILSRSYWMLNNQSEAIALKAELDATQYKRTEFVKFWTEQSRSSNISLKTRKRKTQL